MSKIDDKCPWFQDRIDLYLDQELDRTASDAFERHVETCAACKEELSLAADVVNELRSLPTQRCPERVVDEAMQRAGGETPRHSIRRVLGWLGGRSVLTMRPAMAAMILVVLAATIFVLTQHEQSPLNGNAGQQSAAEHSEKELELAKLDAMLAFAYLGKYSRRTGEIVKENVITNRVVRPLGRTIVEPMNPFPLDK
jgi:anti-sigma factor RsiW